MEVLGLFLLKSAAWLTGFALVYLLVLRNERYFRLNRIFLLSGIFASLLFPLYTFHYAVVIPFQPTIQTEVGELSAGAIVPAESSATTYYFWLYLAGTLFVLLRLLFQTWKIFRKLQMSGYEDAGAVKLVRSPEFVSSFSFFSFVFVNPSVTSVEMEEIINHEREHIQQRHWFDLLLVQLLCIVQWFNPFAWIYAHLVRQNHEYLADEQALQNTVDPAVYQAALLNQLMGAPVFSLTNSFSYSLNKKRFTMMKKKIDSPFRKLKMLVVLPLISLLFYAFAEPDYRFVREESKISAEGNTVDIKGRVVKSDGTPLYGTSVILMRSTKGTVTGPDGSFELKGIPADGVLVFSFVGYKTSVQKAGSEPMNIVMEPGKVGLDEVVVVGYGTPPPPSNMKDDQNPPLIFLDGVLISKSAMEQVKPEEIASMNVLKGQQSIDLYGEKGKNGAIWIISKSKAGNNTDTIVSYEVRNKETIDFTDKMNGPNPPLIILDDKIISKDEMAKVKPVQIESISVLKDKSATTLFGEKGKNGVILITSKSKSGNTGEHAKAPEWVKPDWAFIENKSGNTGEQAKAPQQMPDNVFVVVEEMPEFPGGELALRDFIGHNIRYPEQAQKEKIQGKVFVTFVVKSDGTVGNAKVARGVHPLLDNEAVRVINALPVWKPGKQKGVPVSVSYTVPVKFALDGGSPDQKIIPEVKADASVVPAQKQEGVFVVVEEMPEFPGGAVELRRFIAREIRYPVAAQKEKIQGKVYVSFVVGSNGKVEQPKIEKSVNPALDAEAIRVVSSLPDWKPGQQRGQAVSVAYTIPIDFKLQ